MWGNRTGAMPFGSKKVYLFIGRNKLVSDFDTAIKRAKQEASVLNAIRLNKNAPCLFFTLSLQLSVQKLVNAQIVHLPIVFVVLLVLLNGVFLKKE